MRGARAGYGELEPFVGVRAENAGCCLLPRTPHCPHGGVCGGAEQNCGVYRVRLERTARSVELAERKQSLRIAGLRGCTQVAHGRPAAAGVIACDQAEGEVRRHVATRGHSGEVGFVRPRDPGMRRAQAIERPALGRDRSLHLRGA